MESARNAMSWPSLTTLVFHSLAAMGAFLPTASAQCTREKLLAAADAYVAAQTAGQIGGLQKLLATSNFTYMQDNKAADIKTGVLSQALTIDSRRSAADTGACASYTELIATSPTPYVIGTQIRHNADLSIALVDTIAATTGALFFNASATLTHVRNETWAPIEAAQRDSRGALRSAIDAYLDMWSNATARAAVPFGTPCERIEGGRFVTPCTAGVPNGTSKANTMRRYVIDEVLGSADVLCSFTSVGDIPDSHELRLEGGKVRYVHTITGAWKST